MTPAPSVPARVGDAWVSAQLDISIHPTGAPLGVAVDELVELAVRRNPKRAQLLVSRVLGKHLPTDPRLVYAAGLLLGLRVRELLGVEPPGGGALGGLLRAALAGGPGDVAEFRAAVMNAVDAAADPPGPVVLGNAETATALGHCVADALGACYLHSTRRPAPGLSPVGGFAEAHSHAAEHLLQPASPALLGGDGVLVIVDDELSTGATALNTIRFLHARWPRRRYVVATLIDMRSDADVRSMAAVARELGVHIQVASLATGDVLVAPGTLELAQRLVAALPLPERLRTPIRADVDRVDPVWPPAVADGGRHGVGPPDRSALAPAVSSVAARLAGRLDVGAPVRVLATEEFMYVPLRIADELARLGFEVRYSTTTRSPVAVVDEDGYPIRSSLTFPSHDQPVDGPGTRYAYNVPTGEQVVLITDAPADTDALQAPGGLLDQLRRVAARVLLVAVPVRAPLPEPLRGPDFGSYQADEVGWLLTDLSAVELEAPTEEREEAIQSGGAHYAQSLPVEYQPSAEYQQLFREALTETATRLAHAVGVVTEIVLAERGPDCVLASLARAGTPIGILMRRWAAFAHDFDVPHYAVSIVRGRGIDTVALSWLAEHHDPADVVFVDGWTGKGAITRELAAAIDVANAALGTAFCADVAVLADPGSCVRTFGTREDFLIPSACLNSTVSGLVSRTVLNADLIGPAQFHGAKFYAALAPSDASAMFLDRVTERFGAVAADVARDWPVHAAADRTPTWAGWRAVEAISAQYGIGDATLVKPGVGETTRVLLRRVPWRILARVGSERDLAHILLLAGQRAVPVEWVDQLPYACVGLIHPRYTRGATGADGRTAT